MAMTSPNCLMSTQRQPGRQALCLLGVACQYTPTPQALGGGTSCHCGCTAPQISRHRGNCGSGRHKALPPSPSRPSTLLTLGRLRRLARSSSWETVGAGRWKESAHLEGRGGHPLCPVNVTETLPAQGLGLLGVRGVRVPRVGATIPARCCVT